MNFETILFGRKMRKEFGAKSGGKAAYVLLLSLKTGTSTSYTHLQTQSNPFIQY
jgi:uncharacterized cupin superfamily protein